MCFATMAVVGTVASLAGTAVSAIGSINQGYAQAKAAMEQQKMANYQAQVAQNNAIIAEQNATRADQVAATTAANKSLESAVRLGRVKAAQAASGVDVNTGSASDVQASSRMLGKLDTDTVFSNELLKSYGYRSQAANYKAESDLLRYRGAAAGSKAGDYITSGYLKAGGTLLSSVSSLPLKWLGGSGNSVGDTGPTGASYADELAGGLRPV